MQQPSNFTCRSSSQSKVSVTRPAAQPTSCSHPAATTQHASGGSTRNGCASASQPRRCLTLRSSRPAPAWHLGRVAFMPIIRLAAKAPRLHGRLSSNVRPHIQGNAAPREYRAAGAQLQEPERQQCVEDQADESRCSTENGPRLDTWSTRSRCGLLRSCCVVGSTCRAKPIFMGTRSRAFFRQRGLLRHFCGGSRPRLVRSRRSGQAFSQRPSAQAIHIVRVLCRACHRRGSSLQALPWAFLAPPWQACVAQQVRPNPSLERTSTGLALGPRGFSGYRPPRGPSANPVGSAQLKR